MKLLRVCGRKAHKLCEREKNAKQDSETLVSADSLKDRLDSITRSGLLLLLLESENL